MKKLITYLLLLVGLHAGILYAATDSTPPLTIKQEGKITYVSGGVGDEEREELREIRQDFNLQLTFAQKQTGTFFAKVNISIQNMAGKEILPLSNVGPLLLVKLPAGNYRIKATLDGETQIKTVHVNKKGIKDLYFYW